MAVVKSARSSGRIGFVLGMLLLELESDTDWSEDGEDSSINFKTGTGRKITRKGGMGR